MEHNPLMSFEDGLEITFSDLKHDDNDNAFVVLYFEKPSNDNRGFDSARFVYPGTSFSDVIGFSDEDLTKLRIHAQKLAPLAFSFSSEDEMNYDLYKRSLDKTPEVNVPRVKLDLQALIKYAEDKGLKLSELTEEETRAFIKPIG